MAINMMCTNSECKYYFEDCCQRNLEELRHEIGSRGKCLSFLPGVCNYYDQTGIEIEQEESRWIELEIPKARRSLKNRKKQEVYSEVERVMVYQGYGILRGTRYSVTIISNCEGKGKKIAECNTIIGAYTFIKVLNTFFPHINDMLIDGEMKESYRQVCMARDATRRTLGLCIALDGLVI